MKIFTQNTSYTTTFTLLRIIVVLLCWAIIIPLINGDDTTQVIAPHCTDRCGNVSIPYPFGIEDGCYFTENHKHYSIFQIRCDHNTSVPTPILGTNLEVLNISVREAELRSTADISYRCYNQSGYVLHGESSSLDLKSFTLSSSKNVLIAIGCDTYAWFSGLRNGRNYSTGCMTTCAEPEDVTNGECSGVGCCQTSIPTGVNNITVKARSFDNHISVYGFNPCSVAFPVEKDAFKFYRTNLSVRLEDLQNHSNEMAVPVVYDWVIGNKSCSVAKPNGNCLCQENAECLDPEFKLGYRCICKHGYSGNPYLHHGCKDIDECKQEKSPCDEKSAECINTPGNFTCKCRQGYNRRTDDIHGLCIADEKTKGLSIIIKIIGGIGGGIIVSLLTALWFYWYHGNKKLQKMKESFFNQNGGHILDQKLATRDVTASNMVQMFTTEELVKATDNYSEDNVIGRGGFGMVYKGTITNKDALLNNRVVAIKRSLKVDSSQVEQFINEIVALSQINNRNVVKLLGCCLETEVPLLVYEYISNGTLYHHLHDNQMAYSLTWDLRLRIAAEVSGVLAYLHNTITVQIIHRDIKSANILLDDNYTAKVADFGASKLAPSDQEQLATMVQGTCGYLDPEYMQTGELTEKSDVYSFGVVLVELLTREKAICYTKPENERSLAVYFLRKLKEDRLFEILDEKIVSDRAVEQLKEVANLARRCLRLKGEDRPTMKQVARELDDIIGISSHSLSNNDGATFQEKREYLLTETYSNNSTYSSVHNNNAVNSSSSSHSSIVQLIPVNDGR